MSQSETQTETPDVSTQENWEDLSPEERDDLLAGKMTSNEDITKPEDTLSLEDKASAMDKLQAVAEEKWEAVLTIRGHEVPIPCYSLDESQQTDVRDKLQVIFDVTDIQEEDDIQDPEDLDDDIMEQLDSLDDWLNEFLAEVTVEDGMTEDYWRQGEGIPSGTKLLLFMKIADRMMESLEQVQSFR